MSNYNYKQVQQKNFRSSYDEYYEKMKMARVGISVAIQCAYYEDDKIKAISLDLINKILYSKNSNDAKNCLKTLEGVFNSNRISTSYKNANPNDFKKKIREQMQDFFFEDDSEENVNRLADDIAKDPIQAILYFLKTYIKAFEEIEKTNETKKARGRIIDGYDKRPVVPIKLTQQNMEKVVMEGLFNATGPIDESVSRYIIDYYKKLGNNSSNRFDFYYPNHFYNQRNVNDIFNFYSLSKSENTNTAFGIAMRYYNLVRLGELAANITYADLISGNDYYAESTEFAKFIEQFEPRRVLEIYEKKQNEYIKMYKSLSDIMKDDVAHIIKTWSWANSLDKYQKKYGVELRHNELMGSKVATVNQIKKVINNRIANNYLSRGEKGYSFWEKPLLQFIPEYNLVGDGFVRNSIGYSLKHMSAKEIANLYLKLRGNYSHKDRLQLLFAKLIRDRMVGSREVDKLAIGEDNNKEYLIQIEKDLVAICKDFFNETPAFETKFIKTSDVKSGYAHEKITASEEFQKAERRYYNMPKFMQALSAIDMIRLEALSEKIPTGNLSPEEYDEVYNMFRR